MRFNAVLFDLDGTLIDTLPDLADATNAMLIDLGLAELDPAVVGTLVGKGIENLVRRALQAHGINSDDDNQAFFERALNAFLVHYERVNGARSQVYPGTLEGLKQFQNAGVPMAVVTNKTSRFAVPLLERTGLLTYFQHVVGGDTCARKKPDPLPFVHACELLGVTPEDTLAVGDSVNDALAARAAGMTVLAVPYGYNEGHSVHDLDVDAIVNTIEHAAQWAQQPH